MAFRLVRRTRTVVLLVPVWLESGFGKLLTGRGPSAMRL
jgi:hypothetical protein